MSSLKTKQNDKHKSKQKNAVVSKKAAKAGNLGNNSKTSKFQRGKHPLFGSSNFFSNTSTVPSAFVNIDTNSTFQKLEGPTHHKGLGLDGVALVGCQPFANVTTTGSDSQFWTGTNLATLSSTTVAAISPDYLNGPLAAQANLHSKYFFTDIMLEYVSTVATTQAGAGCISLSKNVALNAATSFAENRQITPSVTFPFRADRVFLHIHSDDNTDLFWTEIDVGSDAGTRQTVQYICSGWPSQSSIGALTMGYINIWYRIELYGDVQSQGFTARLKSNEEAKFLNFALKMYREEVKSTTDEKKLDDERKKEGNEDDFVDIKPSFLQMLRDHFYSSEDSANLKSPSGLLSVAKTMASSSSSKR